jgi:uncharacterized lipoprotein
MKNLFYFVIIALLLGGCSYKNEGIALNSYKAQYAGPISKEKKSVYIKSVQDPRIDKRSIGYYLNDDEKSVRLYSDVNFADKYKEGLGYALNIAGFSTVANPSDAPLSMEVSIKKIELIYNDKVLDSNLKGEMEVEVIIKNETGTVTHNFKQQGSTWIKPSYNSKDLEPFLYTLFSDSIDAVVAKLTHY